MDFIYLVLIVIFTPVYLYFRNRALEDKIERLEHECAVVEFINYSEEKGKC